MSTAWEIIGHTARLQTAQLRATLDLWDPAAGLLIESVDGEPTAGIALFGVRIDRLAAPEDQAALECFVRGDDLVARYVETTRRRFRTEVYWRAIASDTEDSRAPISGIDLILSVQTSRLDIDAALAIHTMLAGAIDRLGQAMGEDCFLFHLDQPLISYLEMVHPSAIRQTNRLLPPTTGLAHRLFVQRLEKGVILRSRIRGLFVPREHERQIAEAEYQRFKGSEPPLTV